MTPPEYGPDGFQATIDSCKALGLDLTAVPSSVLRLFYQSGVAFAQLDHTSDKERQVWRDSIIWPGRFGGVKHTTPSALVQFRMVKQISVKSDIRKL